MIRPEGSNNGEIGVGGTGASFDWRAPLETAVLASRRMSRPREEFDWTAVGL